MHKILVFTPWSLGDMILPDFFITLKGMKMRFSLSYSIRALLVLQFILCAFLAYYLNWSYQRRCALSEEGVGSTISYVPNTINELQNPTPFVWSLLGFTNYSEIVLSRANHTAKDFVKYERLFPEAQVLFPKATAICNKCNYEYTFSENEFANCKEYECDICGCIIPVPDVNRRR